MTTTAVVLGGLSLIDDASLGGRWRVLSLDGWYGRGVRRSREAKAGQDGSWPSTGFTTDLAITIRGVARFPSAADAKVAARQFLAIDVASSPAVSLVVTDGLGTGSRNVEVDGLSVTPMTISSQFEWSATVTAVDPLLYGAQTFAQTSLSGSAGGAGLVYPLAYPLDYGVPAGVTPGAVSLPNDGTAGYWPRLRVDGPVPNPVVSLVETGDWVRYGGTVAAGQWLDFDLANRRVLLNGQVSVRSRVSSSGNWLAVPPGGGSVSWTADAADPAAALSVWGYQGAWL